MIIKRKKDDPSVKIREERGFTLIEVLVAVSILTVGLLAVAAMQVSSIRGNAFAGSTSMGTTWASDKIEKMIKTCETNYSHTDLEDTDGDGDAGLDHATSTTADHQETRGNYTIFWNVSENSLIANTKTLNVIVTWTDHGASKNVSMRYVLPRIS